MSEPRHAATTRPVKYSELLANREFSALYAASAISWAGDFLARAAVVALVFSNTRSVVLSASAFAVSYLPALTCGPLLAAMAERLPGRTVMIACDVARAVLIALVAAPGLPTFALLALLFATTLLNAPFDASRSALLPRILTGDRYVAGVSLQTTTANVAQVCGYFAGGAMAPFYPHAAILIDSATFLVSAALLGYGVKRRDPIAATEARRSLLRETGAGFRLVLANPVLRAIAALVFGAWMFAVVPEALAAAWAGHLGRHASSRGFDQAIIMISVPVGMVLGSLVTGRLLAPERRRALIRPLSLLVPAALIPTLVDLPAIGVALFAAVSGFAVGGMVPPANGLFVQALPGAFRARAFGVMQFGLQLVQAIGVFAVGAFADHVSINVAVGSWSVFGVILLALAGLLWPSARRIEEIIAATRAANAGEAAGDRGKHTTRPSPGPAAPTPRQPVPATADLQPVTPVTDTANSTSALDS